MTKKAQEKVDFIIFSSLLDPQWYNIMIVNFRYSNCVWVIYFLIMKIRNFMKSIKFSSKKEVDVPADWW